ncbi:F-box protein [Quillaja saponaria]|uniref:F-box protein n=1 Tax=Quillaja saponaria TaxID=32244 RepID=A0AAD7LFH2_QUISA|nr:F-box protein [Quillaja saponaria]
MGVGRFRVVILLKINFTCALFRELHMEVFSSERGEWIKLAVPLSKYGNIGSCSIAHKGRVHFIGPSNIIVYDLSNDYYHTIDFPTKYPLDQFFYSKLDFLGVSRGRMRACQLAVNGRLYYPKTDHDFGDLKVWELIDYENQIPAGGNITSCWSLVHKISFDPNMFTNIDLPKGTISTNVYVLAYDPNDGDVLCFLYYTLSSGGIDGICSSLKLSFNLRTKKLESLHDWN